MRAEAVQGRMVCCRWALCKVSRFREGRVSTGSGVCHRRRLGLGLRLGLRLGLGFRVEGGVSLPEVAYVTAVEWTGAVPRRGVVSPEVAYVNAVE